MIDYNIKYFIDDRFDDIVTNFRYASGVKKGPDPRSIQNDMREEFSMNITYWKAWKAKEWAQNLIRGTPEENYRHARNYHHIWKC